MSDHEPEQLNLLGGLPPLVHYFDKNGALRTGVLVRRVKRGLHKGKVVVEDSDGRRFIPARIRNIEYRDAQG